VGRADSILEGCNSDKACQLLHLGDQYQTSTPNIGRLRHKTTRTGFTDQAYRALGWQPPEILRELLQNMMDAVRSDAKYFLQKLTGGSHVQPVIYAETEVVTDEG
jgi:hypothetical protein